MEDVVNQLKRSIDFQINGATVAFTDAVVTGREALACAGLVPASDYQLILVRQRRTHLIGADDEIDLKAEEGGFLRAFRSDRCFSFTVDEVGQIWGSVDMEVDEFLTIWPPSNDYHWLLERENEADTVLTPGGLLFFGPEGVEHIVSRHEHHPDKVLVTVITTAGTFPAEGAKRYPASTQIAQVLADAARKLRITDSATWIVTVAGQDVNPAMTFLQAGLAGEVALEWGAREGGGGADSPF